MADIKKFLNASGLTYLWSKILAKNYIDKNALETTVNIIDEAKLDKTEVKNITDLVINLIYTTNPSEGTLDKTFEEIQTALNNKQSIYLKLDNNLIPLTLAGETSFTFSKIVENGFVYIIILNSNNTFTYTYAKSLETPEGVIEYFNKRIVYSETAPEEPIQGTVWLIP